MGKTLKRLGIALWLAVSFGLAAAPPAESWPPSVAFSASPKKTDRYDEIILRHCRRYRLDPRLVKAIIAVESEFSNRALSPKGARGLMQLMPATARGMGVAPGRLGEPEENIRAGTAYLATLFVAASRRYRLKGVHSKDTPDWVRRRVIAAYNFGPRAFGAKRHPGETRRYVQRVMMRYGSSVTLLRPGPPGYGAGASRLLAMSSGG